MSAPAIAPVGLTSGEVLPGIYLETNFAQGLGVGSGLTRAILVLANKTAAGTATPDVELYGPDTTNVLQTEPQMINLGGPGSEAHRLFRRMAAITGGQNGPPIYWLFVTESAGAKASGTITIAGTASGNATHRTWVGDEYVDTGIFNGDLEGAVATSIAAKVNAQTHWPVTAAAALGVVTLTAKQNGLRGNWIRYQAAIITSAAVTTTTTATSDAFLTGGAASDSNTAALATIAARWFYQIVSAAEDSAQVGALSSQASTQALAINGIRQRVFFGSVDTIANAITAAVGKNSPRAELIWSEKSPWTPGEWAANNAMVYALEEADELGFRTNFIGYGNDAKTAPLWKGPKSRVAAAVPTPATLRSALSNGITPIGVNPTGSTYIVDRFTTRSLNGAQPDPRIREAHKVTITDRVADALIARLSRNNAGKVIGDDPPKGGPPGVNMATPRTVRMDVYQTVDEFAANSKLQRADEIKAGTVVQREENPTSRMGIRLPLQTIDNYRQSAVIIDQVA
jgi:phage tail sheath gpL-like